MTMLPGIDKADRNAHMLADYQRLRPLFNNDVETFHALSNLYPLKPPSIGRIVRQMKDSGKPPAPPDIAALQRENARLRDELDALKHPPTPSPMLRGDATKIGDMLEALRGLPRYARVMVASDQHMPHEDRRAARMTQLISHFVRPDLIVYNGDMFSFDTISMHFAADRRLGKSDVFRIVRQPYREYVDGLWARWMLFLDGNHNARVETFINMQAQQFDETIEDAYAELVRYDGRVMWRGGLEEIDVGGLHIHHGTRTGENSAKTALIKDFGGSQTLHQGHTHGFSYYVHSVKVPGQERFRVVSSLTAGFEGLKPQPYQAHSTMLSKWIFASTIYHVNMQGEDVHAIPIIYHETPQGGLVAFYGSKMFRVNAAGEDENPSALMPLTLVGDYAA